MRTPLIEVCCGTSDEILAAAKVGVDRIEVSAALSSGGVTPTPALVEVAMETGVEIAIMLRSAESWLTPSASEIEVMLRDLKWIKNSGAKSVVFGSLTHLREVDIELALRIQDTAELPLTFHRIVDYTANFFTSLELLTSNGFPRVLTSGGKLNVDEGFENLTKAQSQFGNQIKILAGGGVNPTNAPSLVQVANLNELHFSMATKTGLGYGDIALTQPDIQKIKNIKASINV